jgi:porphobilinogen synthase
MAPNIERTDYSRVMPDSPHPGFPTTRLRRLRYSAPIRRLVRETNLSPSQLVLPLFVRPGVGVRREIASMPGHAQLSPDLAAEEARQAAKLGLGGVILFGIPDEKDPHGSDSYSDSGIIQKGIRAVKDAAPDIVCMTDVCLCEYTDHGHCGVVKSSEPIPSSLQPSDSSLTPPASGLTIDNDATLELLARQAVSHAQAGADVVAPSGMMDGMVGAIRKALDAAGFERVPILSYAVKYSSAFYGPFREAAESAPRFGDRRSYQMDPAAAADQAIREVQLDLAEGADMVMVKPALAYLDVIRRVHDCFPGVPLAAYNVSGEYSMVKAAAAQGWLDQQQSAMEMLVAIRRAGASIVLTYWAKEAAQWLA